MIYIGIDIAKNSHFASAVNSDGEVLVKPFKFSNEKTGFESFINTFKKFNLTDCLIGLESTGIYGDNLTCFLFNKGFKIGRINPIQLILYVVQIFVKLKMIRLIPSLFVNVLCSNNIL